MYKSILSYAKTVNLLFPILALMSGGATMVREARFAWDSDNPNHHFRTPDCFDDEDGVLDPLAPDAPRRKTPRGGRPESPARRQAGSERRHLADADWLQPKRARSNHQHPRQRRQTR
jgi:hypothetical protein